MRTQPVEFLEFVEFDLRLAQEFYDSWKESGAQFFLERFRESVTWIEWNPELFPRKYRSFRRGIIRKTYFGIYYVIEPDATIVVAVLDLRREPRAIHRVLKARIEKR